MQDRVLLIYRLAEYFRGLADEGLRVRYLLEGEEKELVIE